MIQWDPVNTIEDAFDSIKQMRVSLSPATIHSRLPSSNPEFSPPPHPSESLIKSSIPHHFQIRGAPAIASLAALTVSLILTRRLLDPLNPHPSTHPSKYTPPALTSPQVVLDWLFPTLDYLESSRPTAVNLQQGMDRIRGVARSFSPAPASSPTTAAKELTEKIVATCQAIEKEDLERCITMSKLGAQWLVEKIKREKGGKDKLKVMTVCNTGSLATSVRYHRHCPRAPEGGPNADLVFIRSHDVRFAGLRNRPRRNNRPPRIKQPRKSLLHPINTLSSRIKVDEPRVVYLEDPELYDL